MSNINVYQKKIDDRICKPIEVIKQGDETIDNMLKRFKRKVKDAKIMIELSKREYYIKPSLIKKEARRLAILRTKSENGLLD